MAHPSNQDPNEHSSVLMQDSQGGEVAKGHVTSDESTQGVGSSPFKLPSVQCELPNCPYAPTGHSG